MILKNIGLKTVTVLILSSCYLVLLIGMLTAFNIKKILTLWGSENQIAIYLSPDASEEDKNSIQRVLSSDHRVAKIEFQNKEKAVSEFQKQIQTMSPGLVEGFDLNEIIPEIFLVDIAKSINFLNQASVMKEIAERILPLPAVQDVRYGQEWLSEYESAMKIGYGFIVLIGTAILFAGVLIVANAIRASIEARRNEVEVMELIGASRGVIRRPHIFEGIGIGALSASIAVSVLGILFQYFSWLLIHELNSAALAAQIEFFSISQLVAILFAAGLFGGVASYLSIQSINTGWAAAKRA